MQKNGGNLACLEFAKASPAGSDLISNYKLMLSGQSEYKWAKITRQQFACFHFDLRARVTLETISYVTML